MREHSHFCSCSAFRLSQLNLQMLLTRDFDVAITSFLRRRAATWFVQKVFYNDDIQLYKKQP